MSGIYEDIYSYIDNEFDAWFWEQIEAADGECAECFDCDEWCKYAAAA